MTQLKKTPKYYENLGRAISNIYETGYLNKNEALKNSFLKGLVGGVGGVVGATLVVAILLWILSLLGQIPFVDTIRHTLENR